MKRFKLLVVLLLPLVAIGCTATNTMGQQEISWLPAIIWAIIVTVGVVFGAIGLGNALRS